jgi:probable lipoprotein (TIGR04455 family)
MRVPFFVLVFAFVSGCSIVKASFVRDDWAQADQKAVKRLALVVSPLPDGKEKAGEAFARIARRYVNQKRDFLVKKEVSAATAPQLTEVCGGEDAIEGVLLLKPALTAKGDGFEIELKGSLARCPDGREAWSSTAYVQEFGAEVGPYVPPAMNVLRPLLDTLPQPVLTEADVDEKLTLD